MDAVAYVNNGGKKLKQKYDQYFANIKLDQPRDEDYIRRVVNAIAHAERLDQPKEEEKNDLLDD